MIYNLAKYLRNKFTTEKIFANGRFEPIPDRNVLVTDTGGTGSPFIRRDSATAQIQTQDIDSAKALKLAEDIREYLDGKWSIEFPAITVDGNTYPKIKVGQIRALQRPYLLTTGLYVTNYQIIFQRN